MYGVYIPKLISFTKFEFFFADNFVCQGGDEKKQHPRTRCHWDSLVQRHEHRGVEQKGRACSRASHQALEGIRTMPFQNISLLFLKWGHVS